MLTMYHEEPKTIHDVGYNGEAIDDCNNDDDDDDDCDNAY